MYGTAKQNHQYFLETTLSNLEISHKSLGMPIRNYRGTHIEFSNSVRYEFSVEPKKKIIILFPIDRPLTKEDIKNKLEEHNVI